MSLVRSYEYLHLQFALHRCTTTLQFLYTPTARGVDYPNVTHVIQYGPAENRETYIHRLGRTGRAGKHGVGILVLGGKDEERTVIRRELKGLNVTVRLKLLFT